MNGQGGLVLDSISVGNGGPGVTVNSGEVRGCVVSGNAMAGISAISGVGLPPLLVVTENVALASSVGVQVANASILKNLLVGTSAPLRTYTDPLGVSSVGTNVLTGTGAFAWIANAVSTRPNVCNGSAC